MAIISDNKPVNGGKEYPIASEGLTLIVLADVEDIGMVMTESYGPKPQVRLTWVVDEKDPEGNYFVIRRAFTNSLHENSQLYPVVKDILGKVPPTPYDLELLIGKANYGVLKQTVSSKGASAGKKFTNIVSFLAAKPGQTFAVPSDFVRGKDGGVYGKAKTARNNNSGPAQQPRTPAPAQQASPAPVAQQVADEDIPF
jgi:hypothetical protein